MANVASGVSTAQISQFVKEMRENTRLNNRNITHLRYRTALDNHYPSSRNFATGFAVSYSNDMVEDAIVLWDMEQFPDDKKIGFLVDDGNTVRPYYLASWNVTGNFYILQPIPTTIALGPRKMYHLKVEKETWV